MMNMKTVLVIAVILGVFAVETSARRRFWRNFLRNSRFQFGVGGNKKKDFQLPDDELVRSSMI